MASGNVSHFNQNDENTRWVYLTETDTMATGYVLCYQQDANENGTSADNRLGTTVEKPETANLNLVAGFVHHESDGVVGPGWVKVNVPTPRRAVEAWTNDDMTVMSTALAATDGSYALVEHTDATLNIPMVAIAGVTEDTTSAAALSTVFWL